ncbi:type II secretion system protein N [Paraglaciecola aquimarina]|uniref:Type II secretion system protein N n=1 Tax=Paraglaciecola algarum TaxID=3050085 RepID=A0ABS9D6Y1_9ALTE|nr:type II secretion system protein N [Paraglaciecola sp. G1-23]MCF2947426.1 type II secretion system protein N [Paraglaciecola sp. G1-23]
MKSILKWFFACFIIYCVFLVVKLPAVHVLAKLNLPTQLQISGVSGTIWNGQAQSISFQGLPIENVKWSLSVLPLLVGDISAEIKGGNVRQADQISISGQLKVSASQIQANSLQTYLPADLVMMMLPLPMPVQAEGRFKVELTELNYDLTTGCQVIDGKGQWLNAKVAGVGKTIDLGNFDATLGCENNETLIKVKEPNSFGLTAQVNLPANMKFKVNGRFKPAASLPKEVHQAALFFGNKGNDGYYPIKF